MLAPLARLSGHWERALFARYLERLTPSPPLTTASAWAELRLTRLVQHLEALPWHIQVDDNGQLREHTMIIERESDHVRRS